MVRAMTKRFGRLGTALIAVAVLAMGSGLVVWASDPGGGGSSEGHISSFTVEEGDGYWDGNIYKIAIGGNLKLLATCDCSSNDSHTITITGPGWAAETSTGGVTSFSVGPKACDTAGKFTCTATCTEGGSKELTVYVFEVKSVDIEKDDCCAGAIDSDVHKSKVTVELNPAASFNAVKVKLGDGAGYTDGVKTRNVSGYGTVTYGGPRKGAKLVIDGQTLEGAPTDPDPITISVGSDGKAEGYIISSNLLNDEATVSTSVGTSTEDDSITFGRPSLTVTIPESFEDTLQVSVVLSYSGTGVDSHMIKLSIASLRDLLERGAVRRSDWGSYIISGLPGDVTTASDGTGTLNCDCADSKFFRVRAVGVDNTALE